MKPPPELFLLDNGSLEPGATLSLRRLADALGRSLDRPVSPVSLLHSHKIPAEKIDGIPAETFERAVKSRLAQGRTAIAIVPLFFGPSGALTDYLPERIALLRAQSPELEAKVGRCLANIGDAFDNRLAGILADGLSPALGSVRSPENAAVILVDHGSPKREVNAVREHLKRQLGERLGGRAGQVLSASMERRPEPAYDFNEPLLERALENLPPSVTEVLVSQLFFSPGRHAGPGGDIETICAKARERRPCLKLSLSALVGEHPELVAILRDRALEVLRD